MSDAPPTRLQPHNGVLILVLGILSIVLCNLLGPFAWAMGSKDLAKIDAGIVDPEGRGLAQAGKICGIIGTVFLGVGLLVFVLWILIAVIFVGAAAAGGG